MTEWKTIEAPAGSYIGWGNRKGQYVEGEVTDYSPDGGTDFTGARCPQLGIRLTEKAASFNKTGERTDFSPGAAVQITCGQVKLKAVILKTDPKPGDLIRVELADVIKTANGNTLKDFIVKIAESSPAANNGDDGDEPPF